MSKNRFRYGKHDFTEKRTAQERRFDSIARLLNSKDDVCTAVCFNQGQILIANNSGKITPLQQGYIEFFRNCVIGGQAYTTTAEFKNTYRQLLEQSIEEESKPGIHIQKTINIINSLLQKKQPHPGWEDHLKGLRTINTGSEMIETADAPSINKYFESNNPEDLKPILENYEKLGRKKLTEARQRLKIDIDKVVNSLTEGTDTSFSPQEKEAFKKPFLFIGSNNDKLHAEMKIIDYLYQTHQLDTNSSTSLQHSGGLYIGISKLCCLNCSATIKTLKDTLPFNITEDVENRPEGEIDRAPHNAETEKATATAQDEQPRSEQALQTPRKEVVAATGLASVSPIKIRGYHLNSFPNWPLPSFLIDYPQLKEIYEENLTRLGNETKTGHQPGNSPTPVKKTYLSEQAGDLGDTLPPPLPLKFGEHSAVKTTAQAAVARAPLVKADDAGDLGDTLPLPLPLKFGEHSQVKTTAQAAVDTPHGVKADISFAQALSSSSISLIERWEANGKSTSKISFKAPQNARANDEREQKDTSLRTPAQGRQWYNVDQPLETHLHQQGYYRPQHFVDTTPKHEPDRFAALSKTSPHPQHRRQAITTSHSEAAFSAVTPQQNQRNLAFTTPQTTEHQQRHNRQQHFVDTTPQQEHALGEDRFAALSKTSAHQQHRRQQRVITTSPSEAVSYGVTPQQNQQEMRAAPSKTVVHNVEDTPQKGTPHEGQGVFLSKQVNQKETHDASAARFTDIANRDQSVPKPGSTDNFADRETKRRGGQQREL